MPEEQLKALEARAADEDERCPVLARNWKTVQLFLAMSTQWRWATAGAAGMGGAILRANRVGLDYGAIAPTAALAELQVTAQIFDNLRIVEAAALDELATIAAKGG